MPLDIIRLCFNRTLGGNNDPITHICFFFFLRYIWKMQKYHNWGLAINGSSSTLKEPVTCNELWPLMGKDISCQVNGTGISTGALQMGMSFQMNVCVHCSCANGSLLLLAYPTCWIVARQLYSTIISIVGLGQITLNHCSLPAKWV